MNVETKTRTRSFLGGSPQGLEASGNPRLSTRARWKKRFVVAVLFAEVCVVAPRFAHGQFLSVFDSIFSSIQTDMGGALKAINQIKQQVQKLYQTTMWPLAALNQARGFVSNSINTYRNSMNQIFTTKFTSATLPGPQQFETLLHSRTSTQLPSLKKSFSSKNGTDPQEKTA